MSEALTKTLNDLGAGVDSRDDITPLVAKVTNLCDKPLNFFSVEDSRLMIGQEVGLEYLVPLAIAMLEEDVFAAGDYYRGDLLASVLGVSKSFWENNPDLYHKVLDIIAGLPSILDKLSKDIDGFERLHSIN